MMASVVTEMSEKIEKKYWELLTPLHEELMQIYDMLSEGDQIQMGCGYLQMGEDLMNTAYNEAPGWF